MESVSYQEKPLESLFELLFIIIGLSYLLLFIQQRATRLYLRDDGYRVLIIALALTFGRYISRTNNKEIMVEI
ncbi:hypothetical protein DFJ43DRAFT_1073823 [Lentinula guzmanii]|uniref:Uncharacterized protein n=1 Tax=Lentinula guzmanii TaxID=2804957 RepID=A0AA38JMH2_9AGAR|nr:hypothetical protein DFJ43DRAFT_1073823 [Lentinula guzmanii]